MRFHYLLGTAALALLTHAAYAQQPALPGAPQPGQPLPAPAPAPAPTPTQPPAPGQIRTAALPTTEIIGYTGEVIGQTYSVETVGGTLFSGVLREATTQTLTFQTRELGLVTIQRINVRQLVGQTVEQAKRGFDYVGNSTHMFIAPTARNLHQGEGSVQVIDIVLTSLNYGVTDNVSVGLTVPFVPFVGIPAVALNTKVSGPLSDKFNLGAGVFYGFLTGAGGGGSGGAGVAYGVATYGTADTNVSFGLGYGIGSTRSGGIQASNTPVGVLGVNARLSRLFSLVNETYLASFDGDGGFGGIAGLRYASPRFSSSLGLLYYTSRVGGGLYPAYLEAAFRFGKIKLK